MRSLVPLLLASAALQASSIRLSGLDPQDLPVANVAFLVRHLPTGELQQCETGLATECPLDFRKDGAYLIRATAPGLTGQAIVPAASRPSAVLVRLAPQGRLDTVTVVSGSRQEELLEESAIRVDAVTRAGMLTTGYERVSDVLQEIPGLLVRRGNLSAVGGQQIQGLDSRQVAILQDGLPVPGARGIKSGVVNLNRQSSDRLSRIEVAKGAASSTYGSDAIGGVINMITREPSAPFEAGLSASGGTLGMFDGRGDLGGRAGNLSYFLDAGQHRIASYRLIPASVTTVGPDISRWDGLAKVRYQWSPAFSLGFTANAYRNREQGRNASETGPVSGLANDSTQSFALVAGWTIGSATFLEARAYRSRFDENSLATDLTGRLPPAPANLNERLARLDATLSRQLGARNFLQGGVEWSRNVYRGDNRVLGDNIGQQVRSTDYWLQDKWTATRILTFTLGGRLTNHSRFGSAAVPKLGAVARLSNSLTLRASFGMGFRAPDLGQLYFRFLNPTNFYQVIGNPGLRPEHSQSLQAGTVYNHRRYRLGMTLFRNNVRDLIEAPLAGTPRTPAELNALVSAFGLPPGFDPFLNRQLFVYVNLAKVRTEGVELDASATVLRHLRASGSYTLLRAVNGVNRVPLTQRHRHQGQLRLDYTVPRLGLTANLRGSFFSHWLLNAATGARGLPYRIFDLYAGKDLRRGFQTFLAIDNLNNSRDAKLLLATPAFDRPDYGRTFRVGLRYRFGGNN